MAAPIAATTRDLLRVGRRWEESSLTVSSLLSRLESILGTRQKLSDCDHDCGSKRRSLRDLFASAVYKLYIRSSLAALFCVHMFAASLVFRAA